METVTLPIQAFAVDRDEARLIRNAARFTGGYEVLEGLAHYLGVRTRMSRGTQRPLITEREKLNSAIFTEISQMPQLVDWSREQGIDNLRYIYGPVMASAAMKCVQTAVNENLYPDEKVAAAESLLHNYNAANKQTA